MRYVAGKNWQNAAASSASKSGCAPAHVTPRLILREYISCQNRLDDGLSFIPLKRYSGINRYSGIKRYPGFVPKILYIMLLCRNGRNIVQLFHFTAFFPDDVLSSGKNAVNKSKIKYEDIITLLW